MESTFEQVVIESLDALEAGEGVATILARYPAHEAELRPILLTAASLAGLRVAHSLEAQAASRQRMLDYAAATTATPNRLAPLLLVVRRLSLAMAALLIVFALLGTGVLFASSETVPGDALYEAKRLFEDARLSLTNDTRAREELQQLFKETRVREVRTLLRMGRSEEVVFEGIIEAIDADTWLVAGIEVVVLDTTSITGVDSPAAGYLAEVSGLTADGYVAAEAIVVRRLSGLPEPAPQPDSAETPPAEPTPTGTITPGPTATRTPTPNATDEETTPEVPPRPTSTPTRVSNENGNTNDDDHGNGNDNDDDAEPNENDGGNHNEQNDNGGGNGNDNDNEVNDNDANENRNDTD